MLGPRLVMAVPMSSTSARKNVCELLLTSYSRSWKCRSTSTATAPMAPTRATSDAKRCVACARALSMQLVWSGSSRLNHEPSETQSACGSYQVQEPITTSMGQRPASSSLYSCCTLRFESAGRAGTAPEARTAVPTAVNSESSPPHSWPRILSFTPTTACAPSMLASSAIRDSASVRALRLAAETASSSPPR